MPPSYRFQPAVIQVASNTAITFHNSDHFTHFVFVVETKQRIDPIRPRESGTLTLTEPGEYDYVCTYHAQQMKGRIIVTGS